MCYLKHLCCLCLENSNEITHYLFKAGESSLTYYEKLTTSLPQLDFNKNYDDYVFCVECCKNINLVYEFSTRCMENLNAFLDYKGKLSICNRESCVTNLSTVDIEEKALNYNEFIEQEIGVMNHRNITENQLLHNINNVKLEQVDEDYVFTQNFGHLQSNNDFGMKIELVHSLETEPPVGQTTDVVIQEDILGTVQGDTEIKIEEEVKDVCLDYEFIPCDDVPEFCQLTEDGIRVHSQLTCNSSKHTDHGSVEIQKQTGEKNITRYELSHSRGVHRSDVSNEEPTTDANLLNATSPANYSRARSDTCSSRVDVLKIHKHSNSEEEGSKQSSSLIAHSLRHPSYVCDVCGMEFENSRNLVSHKVFHTDQNPHVCGICKEGSKYPSNLIRHERIHDGEKSYICFICKKVFSELSNLLKHKRTHSGEYPKPHVCDICHKGFNKSSYLFVHKRTHTGRKNHVCDICQKGFSQSSDLVKHKRIHTGQKPYFCDICKKGFSQSSNLVSHKRLHTGEKPYVCDVCKKGFTISSNLDKHKRTHRS